jgi:adenosylmethionine-8-amino-7-oxononanoate aminotransferase
VEFNTSPPLVDDFKAACIRRGLYVFMRWNLVLMAPPLIINEQELLDGLGRLDEVLEEMDSECRS